MSQNDVPAEDSIKLLVTSTARQLDNTTETRDGKNRNNHEDALNGAGEDTQIQLA